MYMDFVFSEKQYIRIWWIRILVGIIALGMWVGFVIQIFFHIPFGNNPAPDWAMYPMTLLIGAVFPWFFFNTHLKIQVSGKQLNMRYFPFVNKVYTHVDIAQATPTTFRPIREHGGWGIKYSINGVWIYTAYGNAGVEILFRDGKKIIIGSQRPDELASAVNGLH
ncbi:hypothetical protein ACFL0L_00655 [Patescibacteria group bacterium]